MSEITAELTEVNTGFPEFDALPGPMKALLYLEAEAQVKAKLNQPTNEGWVHMVTSKDRAPQIFRYDHDAEACARWMREQGDIKIAIDHIPVRSEWS
ncbi:MAG: hypothetical protein WBA28_04975 [Microbacteriaceae bacterium]